MKEKYFFIILLLLSSLYSFGQVIGDYQSKATGNWNSALSWQTWNGTWTDATSYPGQFPGSYSVTIKVGDTITISSNLSTALMGSVIINGQLNLNPPNPYNITLSTLNLIIDGGLLNFNGPQISLNLPLRPSPSPSPFIELKNSGSIGGSCTHNDEILIGNQIYAVCKSTGSSDYVTFGKITTSGGTINAVITLPTTNSSSCKDQLVTLEGHYGGAAGNIVNYNWIITDPNGKIIPISSGILSSNSDITTSSFSPNIFGNYLISFTVTTDISGINFSNTLTTAIVIEDIESPTLTPIVDKNENVGASCSFNIPDYTSFTTAADNCTAVGSIIKTQSPVSGTIINGHNTTQLITITANDGNGNTNTTSFTITLKDTTNPVLTAEASQNATLNASCIVSIPNLVDGSSATDNCAGTIITQSPAAGTTQAAVHNGTIDVTVTATDAAGNMDSEIVVITAKDLTDPVLTAEASQNTTLNASCIVTIPNLVDGSSATDNCAGTIITQSPAAGTTQAAVHNGTIDVTVTATDAAGNMDSEIVVITAKDLTDPVLTAEASQNATLNASCIVTIPNMIDGSSATDNCTGTTITQSPAAGTTQAAVHNGTIDVTVTATDAAGNINSEIVVITAKDLTDPVLTAEASQNATLNASCIVTIPNLVDGSSATDNCTGTTITQSPAAGTTQAAVHNGTINVTVTATDAAGNMNSEIVVITAKDLTDPVLTAEASQNATLNASCIVSIPNLVDGSSATDNCTGTTITQSPAAGTTQAAVHNGTINVTVTATDAAGNMDSEIVVITAKDLTAPVLTVGANQTANTNAGLCTASIAVTNATFSDNCSGATISYSLSGATTKTTTAGQVGTYIFNRGTTAILYTVTDAAGTTTIGTKTITVTDNIKPTITAPPAITTTTNTACTATGVVLGSPTTADNCAVASVTNNHPSTSYPLGNTTVIWTVTDTSGNTATANQIVSVTDNLPPTITCPGNKTANTSANGTGDCSTTVTLGTPTTSDNCGISSVVSKVAGNTINPATYQFPIGVTTVTWTVTDNAGLTATCNQTVTVIDDENPSISCPGDQNVTYNTNCQFILQDYTSLATTSDNCDSNLSITQSPAPGSLVSAAITTVTLTAKDGANRTRSCTFKVIAIDDIAPTAVCKSYVTAFLSSNGTINIAALNLDNGSSDNCGIVNMTVFPNSFNCSNVGENSVTFTVFDNAGNSDSCTATINIVDNTPPTMLCKNYVVVVDAITRVATIKASNVDNGSNDACGIASLSVSPSVFPDSPNVYTTTTTLTAIDVNGNSNSCVATITVEPPKNLFTYLTGEIVNPIPDNPQPPSALVEVTACPGGITVPKDIKFTIQAIGTYDLQASNILNWEYSNDNGETWILIPNTAGLLTYTLTGLTSDTFVRLKIQELNDLGEFITKTSAEAYARFLPPGEPPIIVSHTALDICLNDSVTVSAESFYDQAAGQFGKGGKFNYAQPDGWRVNGIDGFFPASGNNTTETTWKESNGGTNRTFSGIFYDTSDNTKFAMSNGIGNITTLETPVFSTIGMTSSEAIMQFYTAYYFCNGGSGKIELSFNAGDTYTVTLNTMEGDNLTSGNTTGVHVVDPNGQCQNNKRYPAADPFRLTRLDLGQYAGLSGLRVKFTFTGSSSQCGNVSFPNHPSSKCKNNTTYNVASGWAIDDVGFAFAQVDDELEWTDEDGTVIATGTTATVTPVTPGIREYGVTTLVNGCRTYNSSGTNYININTSLAYAGEDYSPLASNCGESELQLNAYDNSKTAVSNFTKGAWKNNLYVVPNTAAGDTDYPGTGVTGIWSIVSSSFSSCGNSASFSSATDPDAIFTADPGSYTLRWTLTNGCYDELNVTLIDCKTVDFDGTNDYVSFKNNYNSNSNFSIEVWVKPNSVSNTRTVFSRKDAGNNTKGYDLSIVNGQVRFNWYNSFGSGTVSTGSHSIGTDRWYHLAVTFNGSIYKLYIDGIELGSTNGTAADQTADTIEALLGAMDQTSPSKPTNYFHGWIDELKIWNKALSIQHIRQMMNQEIDVLGSDVGGVVIPLKIYGSDYDNNGSEDDSLLWSDLLGYYRMTVTCGSLDAFKGISGRLHNINSSEQQTAPIPYTTRVSNQNWDTDNTWTNFSVWNVPNSKGINNESIDWNIVKTNHKVISNAQDLTLLGLIVQSNSLIITNAGVQDETNQGHGLWITHYLKLDGFMDLVGESQLVQKRYTSTQYSESIFDEASSGYIERDQQGQRNSFNYNYWSSPVSANNSTYTVAGVLRDGTDAANPKTITFGDGAYFADGALSSPIKISNRWILTYNATTPDSNSEWANFYQWKRVGSAAPIKVGDGFSMKGTDGTAAIDATQNYVFVGKPNSGDITTSFLTKDQTYLIGNPYPSALDADAFIRSNLNGCDGCTGATSTFNGVLYFWDHFGLSNNHLLAQYEGGYAIYSLAGGLPAVDDSSLTSGTSNPGSRTPGRYIPVGQAFFVDATPNPSLQGSISTATTPGYIYFKNSQRAFMRETSGSSIFMKTAATKNSKEQNSLEDKRLKIRLGFLSPTGSHRQILLTADANTTNQFDIGYDAQMIDMTKNDIYWEMNDRPFAIQAIPDINKEQTIPLGISLAAEGTVTIKIDALENIPTTLEIYLYDKLTQIYHDIRNKDFSISLPIGEYNKRFSLQFKNETLISDVVNSNEEFTVFYSNNNKMLNIINKLIDTKVTKVYVFNILGQNLGNWEIKDQKQNYIQIPIKNINKAIYIVKIITDKGDFSKKINIE
ncbi:Por secretion system C-terminal sorting domain-containing protein [Flavobacterium granuli]|uniref:Por secretion system C-terminal sorting domain-containing protein n=1 Tax=Flavobacterium granuli TaxID=280093 RepID=A0A1M5J6K3_9FLAO|nr:LamG-like jellyroll fold domain-containing protein [Flavobacterium granuli]SHG36208.1 Por secretion system C-terminal sorting domain-containing protein [Flavobacterium granuli]